MPKKTLYLLFILCLFPGCGKESSQEKALPKITDNWLTLEGKYGRMPMTIRINQGLEEVVGHKDFQHQAGITVAILNPLKNGLPNNEEEIQLKKIEKTIVSELKEKGVAVFAAVVTTGGTREFIFYAGKPKAVETSFKILTGKVYTHTLKLNIQKDKKWLVYKQFSSGF